MMGILTCWTPSLPSLSFSPPRGPGSPARPFARVPPRSRVRRSTSKALCPFPPCRLGAPAGVSALGLGPLLAAGPGAFPLLASLACPAHSVSSCRSQGRAVLQGVGWRGGDPHRRLVAFSPPGRALGCLRSLIQVAPGLWFCTVTVTFLDFLCSGRTAALGAGLATSALGSASRSLHCIHPRALFSGLGAQR